MEKACEFEFVCNTLTNLNQTNQDSYYKIINLLNDNKKNELNFYIEKAAQRKTVKLINNS